MAKNGITSAVDARVYWGRQHQNAYESLLSENKLTIKAVLSMWIYPGHANDPAQMEALKSFYKRDTRSRLRRNQVKMYIDGLISTRTALVLGKYRGDQPDLGIGDKGLRYFNQTRLVNFLNGLQVDNQSRNNENF